MKLKDFSGARLSEAIRIYLDIAYEGAVVPDKVNALIEQTTCNPRMPILDNPNFEVERYSGALHIFLRLGNQFYPHMKLGIIECTGHEGEFILVADTHDGVFAVLDEAPDFDEFKLLQSKNAAIKNAIEEAWTTNGLPTEAGLIEQKVATSKAYPSERGTIMIVDDTPVTLQFEYSVLTRAGFQVIQCSSGYEAVEQARCTHIDLCFMDLMMPGMDGYETIRELREFGVNRFPIVIATAVIEENVEKELAEGFIAKPFFPDTLLNTVESMLH